ncbi:hypothetical protein V8C40DRAFT_33672 [Trichoderma camerunense]
MAAVLVPQQPAGSLPPELVQSISAFCVFIFVVSLLRPTRSLETGMGNKNLDGERHAHNVGMSERLLVFLLLLFCSALLFLHARIRRVMDGGDGYDRF